jgi:hypothetical protein
MERSLSCAERGSQYGAGAGAGAMNLRSYSASYERPQPPSTVQRARSVSPWSTRPAPAPPPVQRAGSTKSGPTAAAGGRAAPGLNLRSYSASYAASYGPTLADTGGQLKRSGSVTNWTSANRRSVNLRGYAPSFAAMDDTAGAVPAPRRKLRAGADDAEVQRRRLVVYKTYGVEGKVRESVRRGVSWIKGKCSGAAYGWW